MRRNANPAPDLHALVERRGGYANITPEEWGAHDRALAEWQERRRMRSEGSEDDPPHAERVDPEAVCVCGVVGVCWRPRKRDGPPIWRCAAHASLWPDYHYDKRRAKP
jgi:hypothetical protein